MKKQVYNCKTGETTIVDMSPEDENELSSELSAPPDEVSKLCLVKAMRALDWKVTFEYILAETTSDIQEDWRLCYTVKRSDENVRKVAILMGKTEKDLDILFRLAKTFE